MKYNFSRKYRLVTDVEYKQVFRNAKKIAAKTCCILYNKNSLLYPRLGIVVSKKNVHRANKRNLFKRIVRDIFRKKHYELGAIDIVIIAYKWSEKTTRKELRKCLEIQLEKLVLVAKKL